MFWHKKRIKKVRQDEEADGGVEDEFPSFSWWTPWKKAVLAAAAAACVAGIGLGVRSCASEAKRKAEYNEYVRGVTSEYENYSPPRITAEGCLTPGTEAAVFRDSVVIYNMQSDRSEFTVANGAKNSSVLCIRPVDGGQVVGLESRVRVSGLDYDDLEGLVSYRAGLKLKPGIPDMMPHGFYVGKVIINHTEIPLSYVEKKAAGAREGEHFYIDLARLAEHGILSEGDFDHDLDVRVVSAMWLGEVPDLDGGSVVGVGSYGLLPEDVGEYIKSRRDFPSDHERIKRIVDGYEGKDNVLAKIRYALDFTDRTIDYHLPELNLNPVDVLDDGRGDCDDYADLFVTIMRAFGVPARRVAGNVTDVFGMSIDGVHAWAEVYVPFSDSTSRWVIVEPTWADNSGDPDSYIGFNSPRLMYTVDFNVELDTGMNGEFNLFQVHRWVSRGVGEGSSVGSSGLQSIIEGGGRDEEE
ncbi:transglutaminase domain-containing protein [Candidatus Woesearchaeota archaeon]|nr:transglutaminase domain-containing protein [Candidatus Woesearchaeota archaeon]